MKREDHPLTAELVRTDDHGTYVRKIGVMNDRRRYVTRRPVWVARWSCWCIRDGYGLMPIIREQGLFRVMTVAEMKASDSLTDPTP